MDKLMITVAPCVAPAHWHERPGLQLTPEAVADEVVRAYNAGATIAHLHVLDESGYPTADLSAFRRTLALIRARCDIVIEGSTGGVNTLTVAERCVALQADVEMASLNPGSVNYAAGVYINSPDDIAYWVQEMAQRGVKPDSAIFETGMIANVLRYVDSGVIQPPLLFTFVLGLEGAQPATAKNLLHLAETLPPGSLWSVAGYHGADLWAGSMAILMGGHARAGFEDSVFYRPGEPTTSNAQLIERLVRIAHEVGRPIAGVAETRRLLALPEKSRP